MRVVNPFFKLLVVVAIVATSAVGAQTINEAKQLWNDGLAAREAGNYEDAITKIESCIDMCVTILDEDEENEEADELLANAEELIPTVKFQVAQDAFEAKDAKKATELFEKALKSGETYGNETVTENSKKYLTQIHYMNGGRNFKAKNFDQAIVEFNKALEYDPNFAKVYFWEMAIAKENNDDAKVKELADKGIAAAEASNDGRTAEKIKSSAAAHFLNKGIDAKKASKYQEAVKYFEQAIEFEDDNANTYYYLATVKNEMGEWNGAIEAASKAVELETSPSENAKMYYELGAAYAAKSDNANACSAFKKAAVGQYAEAANYQLQQLGCN